MVASVTCRRLLGLGSVPFLPNPRSGKPGSKEAHGSWGDAPTSTFKEDLEASTALKVAKNPRSFVVSKGANALERGSRCLRGRHGLAAAANPYFCEPAAPLQLAPAVAQLQLAARGPDAALAHAAPNCSAAVIHVLIYLEWAAPGRRPAADGGDL